ncbi:hypothetical protein B0H63DRAFT_467349 [Podospora didyma]|uniref:Uncharacterized protein n=1 Tax=Podospora didyma TaxID=330526 RepID=A0AAE0P0Q3_9PEZI|nr:hypothetical protein B0H63DRAFT_467349 [Podospora didyma]
MGAITYLLPLIWSSVATARWSLLGRWWHEEETRSLTAPEHHHHGSELLAPRSIISWGGYSIRAQNCPSGTMKCGTSSNAFSMCCPNSTVCRNPSSGYPICCPDGNDCSSIVGSVPACADTSWTLWAFTSRFCCAGDEFGTHDNLNDQCLATTLPVPTSIILGSVTQYTDLPTTNGGANPPKTTSTGSRSSTIGPGGSGPGNSITGNDGSENSSGGGGFPQSASIAIAILAILLALALGLIIWLLYDRSKWKPRLLQALTIVQEDRLQQQQPQQHQQPPMQYVAGPIPASLPIQQQPPLVQDSVSSSNAESPLYQAPPAHVASYPGTQELYGHQALEVPGHGYVGSTGTSDTDLGQRRVATGTM